MEYGNQTTIYGSNVNAIYRRGYEQGKKEQLEQDMGMIQNVLVQAENYEDFRDLLHREIRRIDTSATGI